MLCYTYFLLLFSVVSLFRCVVPHYGVLTEHTRHVKKKLNFCYKDFFAHSTAF